MKAVIIGAGISGLSTACLLRRKGFEVEVLEGASYIGGFAHSFRWNGHTCDWAAHRLFTHDEHILQQLVSLVPMNRLARVSAVHLGGKWLHDPVDVIQLCRRFFPAKTLSIPWTYLTRPRNLPETSFQNYCLKKYGRTLERFLFSPYTVKMFGIPPEQISVEWARKKVRIAGPLDVIRQGSKKKFNYFYYPQKGGYGSICDRLHDEVKDAVRLNAEVTGLRVENGRVAGVRWKDAAGTHESSGDWVISTIPLTNLCRMLGHEPPLTYRAVSAVYVLVDKPQTTPNHWIYYMDGGLAVNRLCEFKNMDPNLGPPETSVVCAEVTDRDRPDYLEKTVRDLAGSGIFRMDQVLDTTQVTREYSYPVYRCDYEKDVDLAREYLARFANLRYVGRAAQFEHLEVDDCFASALQLVRELTAPEKAEVVTEKRAALPVEPLVAAVVVDAGGEEDLGRSVDALRASDYGQRSVILVSGRAGVEELARSRWPGVRLIRRPDGMGIPAAFNAGCNLAVHLGADYVFFTLSRATVEPDLLSQLVRVAQRDPEAGLLTPKILRADDPALIWSIGTRFRKFPPGIKSIGAGRPAAGAFVEEREVDFAVSCGLLVKREVFEQIGLFDPGYAFYYEDIDFSLRARAEGFRVRYVPEARMRYREDAEERAGAEFYEQWGESFSRFYRRHMKPGKLALHLAYLLAREATSGRVTPLWRGAFRGLHQRMGDIPKLGADFIEPMGG
ncbi:MAG: FAD-dependent oxidoreductase [Kiritimatiellae bacterium]|nr:FAD-dependent oxidoreductase [Kiritimatiellia bacterium]